MAGYSGLSMSNNAIQAYEEGKKPVSNITKEDMQKYDINESVSFFRWYVKNCCPSCEWHHTSYKYNPTYFYDVEDCCNKFKNEDLERLRSDYKSQNKPKRDVKKDDKPYYAKIEYSISTFSGKRKYIKGYAVIYNCWAYTKDNYVKDIIRKKIDGKHFYIEKKYKSRPKEMPEDVANSILKMINGH